MADSSLAERRSVGLRIRFEIFKRDEFTCRYCGRKSPEVVLEVDHVVPICDGGSDDTLNLITSCWDCNRGKGGVPLARLIEAEDPHDRALMLLERERQLHEYNQVLRVVRERKEAEAMDLITFWCDHTGRDSYATRDLVAIQNLLDVWPVERLHEAMVIAIAHDATRDLRYFFGVVRNWRKASVA